LRDFLASRDPTHPPYLAILHRLDRPVSGVILFATRRKAAHKISKQFERRGVKKVYWAWVEGVPAPPEGIWRDFIRKVHGIAQAELVSTDHPEGREALTRYRVQGTGKPGSWIELEPLTGRTHQLRVQSASRGHPILGDELYGSNVLFGPPTDDFRARVIALHSRLLTFEHPVSRQLVTVEADLPGYWASVQDELSQDHIQ
jgi:23S rRNA pseudouridine1911/1915/1917 synthase